MSKTNFKNIAKKVIETEIQSLKKLKNNLDKSFNTAVETILNCKNGKVIISGVGKSGIIAKKISSTLSSVGTPSFFVDANSCSHGDLGRITSNDVLILISFSGETSELKNIIQYASRNKKITLIGIVSKKKSLLYKASDVKILMPDVKEAGPGGIVPTSSTIMQLSIGDALAIATMKHKKFKFEDILELIRKMMDVVKSTGGLFTILWHQEALLMKKGRIYIEILKMLSNEECFVGNASSICKWWMSRKNTTAKMKKQGDKWICSIRNAPESMVVEVHHKNVENLKNLSLLQLKC